MAWRGSLPEAGPHAAHVRGRAAPPGQRAVGARDAGPVADELQRLDVWPVRTPRLTIRPATAADWDATWRFRRLPAVARWLTAAPTDAHAYRRAFEDPVSLAKTLVVLSGPTVVGDLMVQVQDAWTQAEVAVHGRRAEAELGWAFHPDHHGQGLATEAVAAVVRTCFEDLGVRRIVATCFAANQASWRLMERLHMRREGHEVGVGLHRTEGWLDAYTYALLADEWRALHADR